MLQHAPARNLKFDAHAKKANAISVSGRNQIRLSAHVIFFVLVPQNVIVVHGELFVFID
jgi:hypothetical protein